MDRKENKKYYFSVEGDTEKWYLDWLKDEINKDENARFKVVITSKVMSPKSFVKRLSVLKSVKVTHICDYESNSEEHKKKFKNVLEQMDKAARQGKSVTYNLGYSNFTFELWIILHKSNCNGILTDRTQYLDIINKVYKVKYKSLDDYKKEKDFNKILSKLTLDDVRMAVERSRRIMKANEENGYTLNEYKKFKYYKENPSLSIWKAIEKIISECY